VGTALRKEPDEIAGRSWISWFVKNAARETTSGQFIPVLDGLRFIAITSVILYHVVSFVTRKSGSDGITDPLALFLSRGDIGVQLFFVISGFIIALPFAKGNFGYGKRPKLSQYYLRRLTRLEPPYILCLLLFFPFVLFTYHVKPSDLLPHLIASLTYLHNFIYGKMSTINSVAWSLEVELQFYLLAPFIALLFRIQARHARRMLLVILIAIFSYMSHVVNGSPRLYLSIVSMAQYFLAGFLLVDVYICDWKENPGKSHACDWLSVAAWIAIYAFHSNGEVGDIFVVVPIFVAYCCAFRGTWNHYLLCRPAIYVVGGMCYTLYLYHSLVIFTVGRLIEKTGVLSLASPWMRIVSTSIIAIPLVLLSGTFLFILIEKPCMKKNWHLVAFDRMRLAVSYLYAAIPTIKNVRSK